jgi:hypothetical protein
MPGRVRRALDDTHFERRSRSRGGRIVFEGTPADLVAARSTLTGEHLAAFVEPSRLGRSFKNTPERSLSLFPAETIDPPR